MTGLTLELQQDALDDQIRCSALLRKALVVSKKLNIREMEEWIQRELNGYPPDFDQFPDYRIVHGEVKVFNPYNGWIPLHFRTPEELEAVSKRKVNQSISELESIVDKSDGKSLRMAFPPALRQMLIESMDHDFEPALIISESSIIKILDGARNAILEWALELEREGITGEGMTYSREEKKAAEQVTTHVTNYIGRMENSQIQQAGHGSKLSSKQKIDPVTLVEFLREIELGVSELKLDEDESADLNAQIQTIDSQLASPKPRENIILESLKSVRAILESAAGSVAAQAFLQQLSRML